MSHVTDNILRLCKVSESEDLTKQSTFDLVASLEQNKFGTPTKEFSQYLSLIHI